MDILILLEMALPLNIFLSFKMAESVPFTVQPLPWRVDSLAGFLSPQNINAHYELYRRYIERLNQFARENPQLGSLTLAEIAQQFTGPIGNNAAQAVNHEFFWKCLSPNGGVPSGQIYQFILNQFGSFSEFVRQFNERAINHFGSGWVWLFYDPTTNSLSVIDGDDAYSPLIDGYIPLLTLDVWEHAYYLDYLKEKQQYTNNFWRYVNWSYIEEITADHIFGYRVRVSLTGQT